MESKRNGFIITKYTDHMGKSWTRDQLIDKIMNMLDGRGMTASQMSQSLKIHVTSLYNILAFMVQHRMVIKERATSKSKYIFRKVQECLLADYFCPTPEEIEKSFNIIDRKIRTVDDGTSKSFNRKSIDPYGFNYLNSVYWEGID